MKTKEDFLTYILAELNRKQYAVKSVRSYIQWLKKLQEYFDFEHYETVTFEQIMEFIVFLKERKSSSSNTIHNALHCFKTIYNDFLNKAYPFTTTGLPRRNYKDVDIFEPQEIIEILNNTPDVIYQLFFSLMYSAGLTLAETKELRIKDIDVRNKLITIKDKKGYGSRKAELSVFVEKKLVEYLKTYKPKTFIFENPSNGKLLHDSTIQKSLKKSLIRVGINKSVSPKSFKYAFVKHLSEKGYPLVAILRHLGMSSDIKSSTYLAYHKIIDKPVKHIPNPLDLILFLDEEKINVSSIQRLLLKISDEKTRDYILEGIHCINSGLYRASVIFIWSGTIYTIHQKVFNHSMNSINSAIQRHYPKAQNVQRIEDLTQIKDRIILEACEDLGIFDKSQKNVLIDNLDLRNNCSHPGNYKPKPIKVSGFLEDIVNIVFL
jgi:site-specific recombinase XerD